MDTANPFASSDVTPSPTLDPTALPLAGLELRFAGRMADLFVSWVLPSVPVLLALFALPEGDPLRGPLTTELARNESLLAR